MNQTLINRYQPGGDIYATIDAMHPIYLTNSFMLFEPVIQ